MGRPLNKRFFQTGTTVNTNTLLVHSKLGSGIYSSSILKQKGSKKFKVQQREGELLSGVAYLVPTDNLEIQEAYMQATDSEGGTYFVSKISGHRATVVRWTEGPGSGSPPSTGWVFITGASAPWTTTTPPPTGYISIESV